MAGFDIQGALKAGYSYGSIADFLSGELNFDVSGARKAGYSDIDIVNELMSNFKTPKQPARTLLGTVGDVGVGIAKSVVGTGEAAVGLADLVTGGNAGQLAEAAGVRFKDTNQILDSMYSPAQQFANQQVEQAKGFVPTVQALVENPSTIGTGALETLGVMGAGGAVGRGLMKAVPTMAGWAAGAAGEGIIGAGSAAESIRQNTPTGDLSMGQTASAVASGIGTGVLGAVGGRIAHRLGFADPDTLLAQGLGSNQTNKGVIRRIVEGGISEGVFEELPQSIQEQVWQNAALDRPLLEGVPEGAAKGMIIGMGMGGAANVRASQQTPMASTGPATGQTAPAAPPTAPTVQPSSILHAPDIDTAIQQAAAVVNSPVDLNLAPATSDILRMEQEAALQGDVMAPTALPSGQLMLPPPAIDGEYSTITDAQPLADQTPVPTVLPPESLPPGQVTLPSPAIEGQASIVNPLSQPATQELSNGNKTDETVTPATQQQAAQAALPVLPAPVQGLTNGTADGSAIPSVPAQSPAPEGNQLRGSEPLAQPLYDAGTLANNPVADGSASGSGSGLAGELLGGQGVAATQEPAPALGDNAATLALPVENSSPAVSADPVVADTAPLVDTMPPEPIATDQVTPRLSRAVGPIKGMALDALQAQSGRILSSFENAPTVHVVANPADPSVPAELRAEIDRQGAQNDVEGAMHNGELWMFADHLSSPERAEFVLAEHEVAHLGLRGVFGDGLNSVLRTIHATNPALRAKADAMVAQGQSVEVAIEELLADMPTAELSQLRGWRALVRAVRTWLSDHGFKRLAAQLERLSVGGLSDQQKADVMVGDIVRAARDWVKSGRDEEVDDEKSASDFITAPNGSIDFGEITDEMAKAMRRQGGKIRLEQGNESYGLKHIEIRHGDDIRGIGFPGVTEFVFDALQNINSIWKPSKSSQLVVIEAEEHGKVVFIQLKPSSGEDYYTVNSAFPTQKNYSDKKEARDGWTKLWDSMALQSSAPAVQNPSAEQSSNVAGDNVATPSGQSLDKSIPDDSQKTNPDIRFSRAKSALTGQLLNKTWDAPPIDSRWDAVKRALQDKLLDTKAVVKSIREAGMAIADKFDPYLQEILYSGRTAKRITDFATQELKPLMTMMAAANVDVQSFEDYLWAQHAQERNAQIAAINPNMPDGGSGLTDTQAQDILAGNKVTIGTGKNQRDIQLDTAKMQTYRQLAARVEAITNGTLDLLEKSGLEDSATVNAWRSQYQHYVPLMRDMESDANFSGAFGLGTGTGQGFSVRGPASKWALGSKRGVVDILANVAMQRERAITRSEKNRVSQAVYGLSMQAPNPEFWLTVNPLTNRNDPQAIAQLASELVAMGVNPQDAQNIAAEPVQRYVDPRTGLVSTRINPAMRGYENVLALRVNGADRFVFFSNDERAQQMVRNLKNLDADQLGAVMQVVAKGTRYFAAINTQFNPIFGVANGLRDYFSGMLNLSSTALRDQKAEVSKNVLPALKGIYIDLRDTRKGKTPTSAWSQWYERYAKAGGQVGFIESFLTSADRAEKIANEIKNAGKGQRWLTFNHDYSHLFGWLSDYNTAIENAVRLSAFKVAIDQGMSDDQAAALAKNLTVNFNKKGTATTQAGALYAFFNASVQGTARIADTLLEKNGNQTRLSSAGKKIVYGGITLGVLQAFLLMAAGYDDDHPPQFEREKNFIIPLPDGKYVKIPLPMGFNVLPNIGRISTEFVLSGFKNPAKRIASLFSMTADAMNPLGSATPAQMMAPTVADPIIALAENKDFTGKQIYRENQNPMQPTAGWTRNKDAASPVGRALSYALNYLSGGGQYGIGVISPTADAIDYLIAQGTGGVGRETMKIATTGQSMVTGEELPAAKMPGVSRFYGETTGTTSEVTRLYDSIKRINEADSAMDEMKQARDTAALQAFIRENPDARLVQVAQKAGREMGYLRRMKRLAMEQGNKDRVKQIEDAMRAKAAAYNRILALKEAA